jgi:hypothetical protein
MLLPASGTIYSMSGTAADDIWDIGYNNNGGQNNPLGIHYDGQLHQGARGGGELLRAHWRPRGVISRA